ncbi:MAG TPA: hypothetical protein VNU45_18055 [Rummeliibacillus sp.]|nr:hypothetical protein [Rummeliibacillus sp.]
MNAYYVIKHNKDGSKESTWDSSKLSATKFFDSLNNSLDETSSVDSYEVYTLDEYNTHLRGNKNAIR